MATDLSAATAAADKSTASSSFRTDTAAEQATPMTSPRAEKAIQVDVPTVSSAKAVDPKDYVVQAVPSETNTAIQVERLLLGLLPPPHAIPTLKL